jgi:hypothetical protein
MGAFEVGAAVEVDCEPRAGADRRVQVAVADMMKSKLPGDCSSAAYTQRQPRAPFGQMQCCKIAKTKSEG